MFGKGVVIRVRRKSPGGDFLFTLMTYMTFSIGSESAVT